MLDSMLMEPDMKPVLTFIATLAGQAMPSPLTPTLAKLGQEQAIGQVNFACDPRVECENRGRVPQSSGQR